MYSAKRLGGNVFSYFSSAMSKNAEEKMLITNALRKAIEKDEFILHYHPIIDLSTGMIAGAEALLRWRHPDQGMLAPLNFIPIAESSGLIVPIGEWVLKTACQQKKKWQDAGFPAVSVAVNLSTRQLRQKNLGETIMGIVKESGIDPTELILEITETTAMQNIEESVKILNELHQNGIRLYIDDFGSGYSSLNLLKRLPIQALKIDRFFTQHIVDDPNDAAIVKAIVAMAHGLNIKVVAEGVESPAQLEYLKSLEWSMTVPLRCDQVQGFFFSKPLPSEQFMQFLATHPKDLENRQCKP